MKFNDLDEHVRKSRNDAMNLLREEYDEELQEELGTEVKTVIQEELNEFELQMLSE